jgi:hypothetical protein
VRGFVEPKKKTIVGLLVFNLLCLTSISAYICVPPVHKYVDMYLSVGLPNPVLRMSRLSRELQGTQTGQQVSRSHSPITFILHPMHHKILQKIIFLGFL